MDGKKVIVLSSAAYENLASVIGEEAVRNNATVDNRLEIRPPVPPLFVQRRGYKTIHHKRGRR